MKKQLAQKFEEKILQTQIIFDSFPWEQKEAYAELLAQTYYYVRHTMTFIATGVAQFNLTDRPLHRQLIKHLAEENGHDIMLINDLKALGMKVEDFPERPQTSALYQSQYYYFDHENPYAHFGYAYYLEGVSAHSLPAVADTTTKLYGERASTFYRLHGEEDVGHFAKGLKLLEGLPPDALESVEKNLNETSFFYMGMVEAISQQWSQKKGRKAA